MKLIHGDCLDLMKDIPDDCIDLCLTDPPYGTTACKWDSVIPFKPMWLELKRIVKDNGAICLFGSEPFSSALRMSNIKMFKYDWIWHKNIATGHVHAKNRPMKRHEIVSVFSRGNTLHKGQSKLRIDYFPQGLIKLKKPIHHKGNNSSNVVMGRRPSHKPTIQEFTNYPHSILSFPVPKRGGHPTQKPVPLLEYLIKTYTLEGEIVLDFTMGSGSTGVAADNLNRNFIGIEKDDKYFKIASDRINGQ